MPWRFSCRGTSSMVDPPRLRSSRCRPERAWRVGGAHRPRRMTGRARRRCRPHGHAVVVPYDPTIYQGAAVHYRPGRPPYSPRLEDVLTQELGLDGTGRLLDGGCGPGVLTVRLADLFDEVIGLD